MFVLASILIVTCSKVCWVLGESIHNTREIDWLYKQNVWLWTTKLVVVLQLMGWKLGNVQTEANLHSWLFAQGEAEGAQINFN